MATATRTPFVCAACSRSLRASMMTARSVAPSRAAAFSSAASRLQDAVLSEDEPRWKQTPPAMRQPLRLRPQPRQPEWKVNTLQEPLDAMYDRFLGRIAGNNQASGRDALPENIKWLAVTHKSFEHGAQGYNDKLAFLGKRIVDLQTSLALRKRSTGQETGHTTGFSHPALDGVENMTPEARHQVLRIDRLADLATQYGIPEVVRWKPKKSSDLVESGIHTVMAHTLYGIIGALALHRGGEVAATVARERILQPLGLN